MPTHTRCGALKHTATHLITLQHTAAHCNTLQHTATLKIAISIQHSTSCQHIHTQQRTTTRLKILQHAKPRCQHRVCVDYTHTAALCNTLQRFVRHCNTLHHTATHCNTLQQTATHCNTLQHTATHCNTLVTHCDALQHTATHWLHTHCRTPCQHTHTAAHCNMLQRTAIHYSTLQHTATRRTPMLA